jgi:hypothetical protein
MRGYKIQFSQLIPYFHDFIPLLESLLPDKRLVWRCKAIKIKTIRKMRERNFWEGLILYTIMRLLDSTL